MRHLLIIASDPETADTLVDACRGIDVKLVHTPDPIHGIIQAMRDEPSVLMVDADDAWLGEVSLIQEVRRHPTLCFTPVILFASGAALQRGIDHGADFIVDRGSRDLTDRVRNCVTKCMGEPAVADANRPSVFAKLAASAKSAAISVTSHFSGQSAPSAVMTFGDLMCDGNLFRRIGDARTLYELRITRERLWLIPLARGMTPFTFDDADTLLENFQFVPFA